MAEQFFNLETQKAIADNKAMAADAALDYSAFKEGPGDNVLAQLAALAREQKEAEAEVERCEEALKKAKANLVDISERKVPEFMEKCSMSDCTTQDGIHVQIVEAIRGSIPKVNEPKAFKWLEDNNHGRLIKREFKIEFGKDEEAWAKKFAADLAKRKKPLKATVKHAVHPQTLQAFVRELLEKGVSFPMDVFGVHRQRVSKITVK